MTRKELYLSPKMEATVIQPEAAIALSFSQTEITEILTDDEETDL